MRLQTYFITLALLFVLAFAGARFVANAGPVTPSANPAATSYTLSDIYDRLASNTAATEGDHDLSTSSAPGSTFRTLTEIYEAIPTIVAAEVKLGSAYLGVDGSLTPDEGTAAVADLFSGATAHLTDDWILDTGTLDLACATSTFDGTDNLVSNSYDGSGDGSNRWCITDSGSAGASHILSGQTAWVDGVEVSGSITNVGSQTITPSTTNQTITEGYHDGAGYCAGDADLTAGNIKTGESLFGVTGTFAPNVPNCSGSCTGSTGDICACGNAGCINISSSSGVTSFTDVCTATSGSQLLSVEAMEDGEMQSSFSVDLNCLLEPGAECTLSCSLDICYVQ